MCIVVGEGKQRRVSHRCLIKRVAVLRAKWTYKFFRVLSCQNLSQNEVRVRIGKTDVESVRGRVGGWSEGGGGDAISKEGLEQFPTAALEREPLWDKADFVGVSGLPAEDGVDGGEESDAH